MSLRLQLKVFVSGSQTEVRQERKAARFVIEVMGLQFEGSEIRPASASPMQIANVQEVLNSDFYVGIFWNEHSLPSEKEFYTARSNGIPVLVYWKTTSSSTRRHPKLTEFYEKIKHPTEGIVYDEFSDLEEFQNKLKKALQFNIEASVKDARKLRVTYKTYGRGRRL